MKFLNPAGDSQATLDFGEGLLSAVSWRVHLDRQTDTAATLS